MRKIFSLLKKYVVLLLLNLRYNKKNSKIKSLNVSKDVVMGYNCTIDSNVSIGKNVSIGDYTYFNSNKNWSIVESNVKIGKFCSIAPGVTIGLGNHNYKYVTTHPILYDKKYGMISNDVTSKLIDDEQITIIGNDVWIGSYANIKRGVKIGNGAIIGMNSLVTHDVPPYAIVGGIPAKIIGYRFNEEERNVLNKSNWWDNDYKKIRDNIEKYYSIEDFLQIEK